MNRRGFFQGAAATVTALLSPKLLGDEVTMDQVVAARNKLENPDPKVFPGSYRALILVDDQREANEIWTAMGRPADIKIIGPAAALSGMRTELVIDAIAFPSPYAIVNAQIEDWRNSCVRTRLTPHGEYVNAHFIEDQFDFGTQTGIAANFLSPGRDYVRQAVRIRNSNPGYQERIDAKAQLFNWYMEMHA